MPYVAMCSLARLMSDVAMWRLGALGIETLQEPEVFLGDLGIAGSLDVEWRDAALDRNPEATKLL